MLNNEQGWNFLLELATVKEMDIRRDAVWTVAILAACPGILFLPSFPSTPSLSISNANLDSHEYIANVFGWKTILFFASNSDPDIQIASNILIANLAVNEENQLQMIAVGGLEVLLEQAKNTNGILCA